MTTLEQTLEMLPDDHGQNGLWIFAYGSLMWRPDFEHEDIRDGVLRGYHRGLCIFSHQYRGTPEVPGLVFGLNRGGSCRGRVLRVAPQNVKVVVTYLYEREMINRVYLPRMVTVTTDTRPMQALAFIADRQHFQYAGRLPEKEAVRLIRQGVGHGGACVDYVASTVHQLQELGIRDRHLERLLSLSIL